VNTKRVTSAARLRAIGVIAASVVLAAACQTTGSDQSSGGPQPTSSSVAQGPVPAAHYTRITLVRAGGIAGFRDRVEVDRSGAWTTTDKTGRQKTGTLTADQLDALVAAAADPALSKEATRGQKPTQCNDAFSYVLTIDDLSVSYVDCPSDADPPVAAKKVVGVLAQSGAL
jgi:hypothetical protein